MPPADQPSNQTDHTPNTQWTVERPAPFERLAQEVERFAKEAADRVATRQAPELYEGGTDRLIETLINQVHLLTARVDQLTQEVARLVSLVNRDGYPERPSVAPYVRFDQHDQLVKSINPNDLPRTRWCRPGDIGATACNQETIQATVESVFKPFVSEPDGKE